MWTALLVKHHEERALNTFEYVDVVSFEFLLLLVKSCKDLGLALWCTLGRRVIILLRIWDDATLFLGRAFRFFSLLLLTHFLGLVVFKLVNELLKVICPLFEL